MNNSVVKNDPKKNASKPTAVLRRKGITTSIKALAARTIGLFSSFHTWAGNRFNQQEQFDVSIAESISDEDKVAILKTQCDYVRSCYRVKILERQKSLENVPQNLDIEIDELLDSYQRLKRAYEELERQDR